MIQLKNITKEQYDLYVGLLTEIQKDELVGQMYAPDSYFNPIQDINDNWIISVEEMANCVNDEFMWVKDLPLIIYEPKPSPPFPPTNL
jgi:hypothetical protein